MSNGLDVPLDNVPSLMGTLVLEPHQSCSFIPICESIEAEMIVHDFRTKKKVHFDPIIPEEVLREVEWAEFKWEILGKVQVNEKYISSITARIDDEITNLMSESSVIFRHSVSYEEEKFLLLVPNQEDWLDLTNKLYDSSIDFEIKSMTATKDPIQEVKESAVTEKLARLLFTDEKSETVIKAAIESGYYKTPRETNLEELAEILDMSKSTVSLKLRNYENNILGKLLKDIL